MKPVLIVLLMFFAFVACQDASVGSGESHSGKDSVTSAGVQKAEVDSTQVKKSNQQFSKSVGFGKIHFHVFSPNNTGHNSIIVQPTGILDSSMVQTGVAGIVMDAFAGDLNGDGYPEIYYTVFTDAKELNLFGYGSEKNKRLAPIYMPDLKEDRKFGPGHRIGDSYAIEDSRLIRTFPNYKDKDPMSSPSGGKRILSYRLIAGKNGWILKPVEAKDSH
jgi:hypothetical protein